MDVKLITGFAEKIRENVSRVIVGNDDVIELLLIALIGKGHVLLDDVPGMGKTMTAKTLAKSLDLGFKRIQFTPDLLPSDVTGINFFNQKFSEFQFRPGPVFTNILLADELNRATPRTQASLLECMEERQVTIDGETRQLEEPFMVIATQNPVEIQGTFPLPEAQLDRFMLCLEMGYPERQEGIGILRRFMVENPFLDLESTADRETILKMQRLCTHVTASDELLDYIVALCEETRMFPEVMLGISPRGSQALLRAAQIKAALSGRDYVIPDDIKNTALPVLSHRLVLESTVEAKRKRRKIIAEAFSRLTVPTEVM
jgi:MoxR-like ATPase